MVDLSEPSYSDLSEKVEEDSSLWGVSIQEFRVM